MQPTGNPTTPTPTPAPVVPVAPAVTPTTTPAATTTPVDVSQFITTPAPQGGVAPAGASPPPYSPNTVNQTVDYGGVTWKGQPGGQWTAQSMSGGGALPGAMGGQPTVDLIGAANALYNSPAIQAANKAISDRQQALANAQANINDNPFYSDASRTGQLQKAQDSANADITVQQNILATEQSNATIQYNALQGQYNIDNTNYQNQLTQFQNLVNQGGLDNMSPTDMAGIATATGIPISMLTSIQGVSQAKDNPTQKPQIVTATDAQGNLSILAVDPNTGKVIQTTTINSVGAGANKTTAAGGAGNSKAVGGSAASWATTDAKAGKTLDDMMAYYYPTLTKKQIYDAYSAVNYYKATPDQVAADKKKYGV